MYADELFADLRRRGLCHDKAAAMVGYTLLAQLVGWDGLKVSHRRRRKIRRTLKRLSIDIQNFRDETIEPKSASRRNGHREGVIVSGRV